MRKKAALLFGFFIVSFFIFWPSAQADELLDVQKQIDQKNNEYVSLQGTISAIKKEISKLSSSVFTTQLQLEEADKKVAEVTTRLSEAEKAVNAKKEEMQTALRLRNSYIRQIYKYPTENPLELLISSGGFSAFAQSWAFQKRITQTSTALIEDINGELILLENNRASLASAKQDLEQVRSSIAAQLSFIKNRISYQSNKQSQLGRELAKIEDSIKGLTEKQKQLIAAKLAASGQNQTIGDQAPPSSPLPDPGFSPAYAFASYGYPHRVGMNQYGAYGRANAGQNFVDILKAYYQGINVGPYNTPSTINVQGYGTISFEDNYLKGIAEMPSGWPMEALKAQAVAARTYALYWLASHPGQAICTSEACQVYLVSKVTNPAASRWHEAVAATRGIVATYNGVPIGAWYSSTDGGYTLSAREVWGGNVPYAQGIADFVGSWPNGAYDKASPWFHKAWGGDCNNKSYPWLNKEQVLDLVNSLRLSKYSSDYNQYLSPVDGCYTTPGWSSQTVRDELSRLGITPLSDFSNIFVGFDGKGNTSSITFTSSQGVFTFTGAEFRSIFQLRSPGTRWLPSQLYDVIIR